MSTTTPSDQIVAAVRDFASCRQQIREVERRRASFLCERAEPVSREAYEDAQSEAQADPLAVIEFPQQTQAQPCWKTYYDDLPHPGDRNRAPKSEWCEPCRQREAVDDELRIARRHHGALLRTLQRLGKAEATR